VPVDVTGIVLVVVVVLASRPSNSRRRTRTRTTILRRTRLTGYIGGSIDLDGVPAESFLWA
jgi:hypothetical protein